MSAVEVETVVFDTVHNESGRLAHVVNCPPNMPSTDAWIREARWLGLEVTALCGYRWVPSADPSRFPVCGPCMDEAARIAREVNGGQS